MDVTSVVESANYRGAVLAAYRLLADVDDLGEGVALLRELRPLLDARVGELDPELVRKGNILAKVWQDLTATGLDDLQYLVRKGRDLAEWKRRCAEVISLMEKMLQVAAMSPAEREAARAARRESTGNL